MHSLQAIILRCKKLILHRGKWGYNGVAWSIAALEGPSRGHARYRKPAVPLGLPPGHSEQDVERWPLLYRLRALPDAVDPRAAWALEASAAELAGGLARAIRRRHRLANSP